MAQSLPTNRAIRDALLTTNIAMPNANATTLSAAFDLGQPNAFPVNEKFEVVVTIPATNIVSAKSTTFTLESADVNTSANFSAVAGGGLITITGTTGDVSVASETILKVPGGAKQFLRLKGVGGANSGTALTEIGTVRLQF
jgi:hypothetical protein